MELLFRVARTKIVAALLGPTGVGLFGIYGSISDMARFIAGMGINSSGVRRLAEASGTGDQQTISRTVVALRRISFFLGTVGGLILLIFSKAISEFSFGDSTHRFPVQMLAIAVLFASISTGQAASLQGLRRTADLARMNIWSGLLGTIGTITCVYVLRENGIVPSLVIAACLSVATAWWYCRKIKLVPVVMAIGDLFHEARSLLKLGVVFLSSLLMTMGVAYLTRVFVFREHGENAAGYYQAAWSISVMFVSFILSAMATDFYPRLTALANDSGAFNRLLNQQIEVGLLIAAPGVLATLVFAPFVIFVLYSARFGPAVDILRWNCLGMLLRVAFAPFSYTFIAKNRPSFQLYSDILQNGGLLTLIWLCLHFLGLVGAGVAYFLSTVFTLSAFTLTVGRLYQFRLSLVNWQIYGITIPVYLAVFVSWYFLPRPAFFAVGTIAVAGVSLYSLRLLSTKIPTDRLPVFAQRVVAFFAPREREA
jgi:PST family polysaccharide transporter